jgi:hypothetical protein
MIKRDKEKRAFARRRILLVAGLLGGAVNWMSIARSGSAAGAPAGGDDVISRPVVPPNLVSLASYGGVPGAAPAVLIGAFGNAFASLMEKGGGTLLVPAGGYDFGEYDSSALVVRGDDLSNIAIFAYGATFKATTTANVMPFLFYFVNPNNVTIAGASFVDPGFNPSVNWKGMYCAGIQANRASRGFRMVDCRAESVVGLFSANNNASTRHYLEDIDIQGEVRNAYYGVGASFIRERVKVNLVCHNVRRAFIANALKNADITVTVSSTAQWPGSNGLVSLASGGAEMGNVEDVRVNVTASGAGIHGSYVHFYQVGPAVDGYMRNIDATVNLYNVSAAQSLFIFDHETDRVQQKTARVWDQIHLHGSVTGSFAGRVISNPSVSSSPGTVHVDRNLALLEKQWNLPAYFRINAF